MLFTSAIMQQLDLVNTTAAAAVAAAAVAAVVAAAAAANISNVTLKCRTIVHKYRVINAI